MSKYDFHALLEPMEFEKFVCDIIQVREGIRVETFKEGKDGGIDGLFIDEGRTTIVQAKRYQPNYQSLYRSLKGEYKKIQKINPDRYILGVSLDLSRKEKMEIIDLFDGYIKITTDILSKIDMNRLLEEDSYKLIELRYHKLWLTSMNVFSKTLNNSVHRPIYKESELEMQKALDISKVFVSTRKYQEALVKSLESKVIILSGEPGVGKTTMAYLLALSHLQSDNLDGFIWANSINDIYAMLDNSAKQVFILDDFWGSIFQDEHTGRKFESRLNTLIKHVKESNGDKRLILTTREYVLQQGLQRHPLLRETMDRLALICTIDEYSNEEKANILYSHLYASNLEYDYVNFIYEQSEDIVLNKNYNPRVLNLFLEREQSNESLPEDYYFELLDYLDTPTSFWEEIFSNLSAEAKVVSLLLLISSTSMRYTDMEKCYDIFVYNSKEKTVIKKLEDCLTELEGTMIKSYFDDNFEEVMLRFTTPAVQDFLYDYLKKYADHYVEKILCSCCFYNQLFFLLEHISGDCSQITECLIVQDCIRYYDEYINSYNDYDGGWNWEYFETFSEYGELDRLFQLIRCSDVKRHPLLIQFIEEKVKKYCVTMGNYGSIANQYVDLHDLPDIIVRCVKKGMRFNGREIIDKYYRESFSVYHYLALRKFSEAFASDYEVFNRSYSKVIKQGIKDVILSELAFLDDYEMEFELDILVDDIPNILDKFDLVYTKKFEEEIDAICGKTPMNKNNVYKPSLINNSEDDYVDKEKRDFQEVKCRAREWIYGLTESEIEEEELMKDIVSGSDISSKKKAEIKNILETGAPFFIYKMLETNESIYLFLDMLKYKNYELPKTESELSICMLMYICQENTDLIPNIVSFCAECFILFMHQDEPIVRTDNFFSSEIFEIYLKDNKPLQEIVFEYLMLNDGRWIRFTQDYLFVFSYVLIISYEDIDGEDIEPVFQMLFTENFRKLRIRFKTEYGYQTEIAYADFGPYYLKRYDWEGRLCRMFFEMTPFKFTKFHIQPSLKRYLNSLGNEENKSKVFKYLDDTKLTYELYSDGEILGSTCVVSDELCLIDHLDIAKRPDIFMERIDISRIKDWEESGFIKRDDNKWVLKLYEVEEFEVLNKLGIYDEVVSFLKEIEDASLGFVDKYLLE